MKKNYSVKCQSGETSGRQGRVQGNGCGFRGVAMMVVGWHVRDGVRGLRGALASVLRLEDMVSVFRRKAMNSQDGAKQEQKD